MSTRLPTTPGTPSRSLLQRVGWRLERRLDVKPWHEAVTLLASFLVGLAICSILIAASDKSVYDSYKALFDGAFGSRRAIYETLVQATPLIFTGLAAAFAFRAKVWNIGGEGQFFAGAMGAFFVSDLWSDVLPRAVMVPVLFIGAVAAGALWASIAGVLKARYDTNEIITTVMLNFIILLILSYLLGDLWRAPDTYYFQTERLPESTHLPLMIGGSRLHWGFGVALGMAVAVLVVLRRTALGYEVRGVGMNRTAGSYKGISISRITVLVMIISGSLAGMAGAAELSGVHHRLQLDISNNFGFVGIIIALVGRLHPVGVIASAIGFGALVNGATTMQIQTGIPAALVDVIQGLTLIFVLTGAVAVRYRLQRTRADE